MARLVLLDSGPLGLLTAPPHKAASRACARWLASLLAAGCRVVVPEIVDYELRRELLRARKTASVRRLDALERAIEYLPITTAAMRRGAEIWAHARQHGQPTAADNTIDVDMILVGQADTWACRLLSLRPTLAIYRGSLPPMRGKTSRRNLGFQVKRRQCSWHQPSAN